MIRDKSGESRIKTLNPKTLIKTVQEKGLGIEIL